MKNKKFPIENNTGLIEILGFFVKKEKFLRQTLLALEKTGSFFMREISFLTRDYYVSVKKVSILLQTLFVLMQTLIVCVKI